MLNDHILQLSFTELKQILTNELSLFDITLSYVLVYVLYKALSRYIYFKPEEHASKINRTFLFMSIFTVLLYLFNNFLLYEVKILPEHKWVYAASALIILTGSVSILFNRLVRDKNSHRKSWVYRYLPIEVDSYKSATRRSENSGPNTTTEWNEETVEFTSKNLHSDMMLNSLALIIFIFTNVNWILTIEEIRYVLFASLCTISISILFVDRGVFKWISYMVRKYKIR